MKTVRKIIDKVLHKVLRFTIQFIDIITVIGLTYVAYGVLKYLEVLPLSEGLDDFMENLTLRIDHVTIWLAGLTFLYSSKIWRNELRDGERVEIILVCMESKEEKTLPYKPMRQECSRAEILGILGVFYNAPQKNGRYDSSVLAQKNFFDALYAVQEGRANKLKITFPKEDFDCFLQ